MPTARQHPLRTAREAQGLSREGLAFKAGVSMRTLERIEGGGNARRATLTVIALALGLDADEFRADLEREAA